MKISNELEKAISNANDSLRENANGELILSIRKELMLILGNDIVRGKPPKTISIGHKRRFNLALQCINKMLIGFEDSEEKIIALNTIGESKKHISGELSFDDLYAILEANSSKVVKMEKEKKEIIGISNVANILGDEALRDVEVLVEDIPGITDDDLDCYTWDTSYFASIFYVGGGPWDAKSDKNKRIEYWNWYINEALPNAYLSTDI